ncbi:MAG: ribonuclease III [Bacteroidota bacterium]
MLRKFLAFKILFRKDKDLLISLREVLGFYPRNLSFYKTAFTHRSASFKINGERINNERLEFLGDSILDAIISDFLYHKYPNYKEGFLTEMRSKIVNGEKLKELARFIRLNEFIVQKGTSKSAITKIHEDAFEALIGAIYLDKGYHKTYKFVKAKILEKYIDFEDLEDLNLNYKSQLIEWAQKIKKPVSFVSKTDADEEKCFSSEVVFDSKTIGIGKGHSKKEAEQNAAKEAISYLLHSF